MDSTSADMDMEILDYDEQEFVGQDLDQASIDLHCDVNNNSDSNLQAEFINLEAPVAEAIVNNDPLGRLSNRGRKDPVVGDASMQEMLASCASNTENSKSNKNCITDSLDSLLDSMFSNNDVSGPPVHEHVARFFSNQLARDFSQLKEGFRSLDGGETDSSVVLSKMKDLAPPSNIDELRPCTVNGSVYRAMPPLSKRFNMQGQFAEQGICRTLTTQAKIMEGLLELKDHLKPSGSEKLQDLLKLTGNSVEFLAFSRARVNEGRRSMILANINGGYRSLASKTVPKNGLLFGDDLAGAMREVEDSNRLAKKLVKHDFQTSSGSGAKAHFLGRGRGRGRNFRRHPYQQAHHSQYVPFQPTSSRVEAVPLKTQGFLRGKGQR